MKSPAIGFAFVVLILTGLPAAAQPVPADPGVAQLQEHVRGIRQALDRMTGLLETVQHQRDIELLFKRIELRERRLEPLERRLRSAESEIEANEDHLASLERMQEQQEETLNEEIREGVDAPRSETRRALDDIKRTQDSVAERTEKARMRAQEYENELARGRREIEILDEKLLEALEDGRR
jgi:chromosome segregation ATPase